MSWKKVLPATLMGVGVTLSISCADVNAETQNTQKTQSYSEQNKVDLEETTTYNTQEKAVTDGWYQKDGYWYYYVDGEYLVDELYDIANEEDPDLFYRYYFNDQGHMVTNQWITADYSTYYFGNDGKAYTGKQSIDGEKYLFSEYGDLSKDYSGVIGNFYYETDENGVILYEQQISGKGWIKVKDRWAYIREDGSMIQGEWYKEKGVWYYFDWEGLTVSGLQDIYDEKTDTYYNYYFDKNGHMVTNQWKKAYDSTYYFGSNGRAYTGIQSVDGKEYLFNKYGKLITNYSGVVGDKYFETAINGMILYEQEIKGKGWIKIKDCWAYVKEDGSMMQDECYQEKGVWYYFGNNCLAVTGITYINDDTKDGYYYFDKNGHMSKNKWIIRNNSWMYFGSDGKAVQGVQTINGKKYLFNILGNLETNSSLVEKGVYYVTDNVGRIVKEYTLKRGQWEHIGSKWYFIDSNGEPYTGWKKINNVKYYFFDNGEMATGLLDQYDAKYSLGSNGHMITNAWWQDVNSSKKEWYYFGSNGKAHKGWLNDTYYMSEEGIMLTGLQEVDQKYYLFGDNGKLISKNPLVSGWNLIDGNYYYVVNGKLAKGWQKIDSEWYFFSVYDGHKIINSKYAIDGNEYYFDSNGHYVKNCWVYINNPYYVNEKSYVYAGKDGILVNGWQKINNVWYYFQDYFMVNNNRMIDNKYQLFAKDGKWKGEGKLDGWVYTIISGRGNRLEGWQYIVNGKILHGWQYINNKYYYFNEYGAAVSDGVYGIDNEYFYFYENCVMASNSGWVKDTHGNYYYLDSRHRVITGWKQINNVWYYLSPVMVKGVVYIDGEYHLFNEKGAWQGRISPKDGWNKYNDEYYYFQNGEMISYQWIKSGSNYYFVFNDKMVTGLINLGDITYYFDNNGKLLTSQWIKVDGKWMYTNSLGEIQRNVTLIIDGKKYSFDANGYMM